MPPFVLVIVESPHKAKRLNELFPKQLTAMATYGQVCALLPVQGYGVSIDRDSLEGRYSLTHEPRRHIDGRRVIKQIKQFLAAHPQAEVYLGMENTQAGESLAAFMAHHLQLREPRRLRFNSFTQEDIREAISAASVIDQNAVDALNARHHLDHIAARTLAPILLQAGGSVSADRIGICIDALVVEREVAISRRTGTLHHHTVRLEMGSWAAQWKVSTDQGTSHSPIANAFFDDESVTGLCLDIGIARAVAQLRALVVQTVDVFSELEPPPSAFCTSGLLTTAGRVLGWVPEKTLLVAQQLYEGDGGRGHITTPHTSVVSVAPHVAAGIHAWLRDQGLPVADAPNSWPHRSRWFLEGAEAIRPTDWNLAEAGATEDQQALYSLIRERALYSQLAPAQYTVQEVALTDARGAYTFFASSRVLAASGWLDTTAVQSPAVDIRAADPHPNLLPQLQTGAIVNVRSVDLRTHALPALERYTASSLLTKLHGLGLAQGVDSVDFGRGLKARISISVKDDGHMEPTKIGQLCYNTLYPRFGFAHLEYAVELEQALDKVASGGLDGRHLVRAVWDRLDADAAAGVSKTL